MSEKEDAFKLPSAGGAASATESGTDYTKMDVFNPNEPPKPPPIPSPFPSSAGVVREDLIKKGEEDSANGQRPRWSPGGQKITLASYDDSTLTVEAQYNPKEVQVDRTVPWQQQLSPEVNRLVLEFSGEDGRTMGLELLFDGYEEGISIYDSIDKLETMSRAKVPTEGPDWAVSYDQQKDGSILKTSRSRKPKLREKSEEELRLEEEKTKDPRTTGATQDEENDESATANPRPHYCFLTWGEWLPDPIKCVIENISTKYTMFSSEGLPLRAIVSLRLREAHAVTMARPADVLAAAETQRLQTIAGAGAGGKNSASISLPAPAVPPTGATGATGATGVAAGKTATPSVSLPATPAVPPVGAPPVDSSSKQ